MSPSDKELIDRLSLSSKDRDEAFKILVNRYSPKLYSIIRRIVVSHDDTDDVLQNCWIKAYRSLPKFQHAATLFTWLYRIAVNESLTFIESAKRRRYTPIEDANPSAAGLQTSDLDTTTAQEINEKLNLAIQSLPPKQQLVFQMRYYDELTYEEIAAALDTSVGALKASYHHAMKKIERMLKLHA